MKKHAGNSESNISFFEGAKPIGWLITGIAASYEREFLRKLNSEKSFASITAADHRILKCLALGISNSTNIARELGVSKQAAGKSIASLEKRGFIGRQESEHDHRAQLLSITSKGQKLISAAIRASLELEKLTEEILGKKDLNVLKALVRKVSESVLVGTGAND